MAGNSIAGLSIVISGNANPFAREVARTEGLANRLYKAVHRPAASAAGGLGTAALVGMTGAMTAATAGGNLLAGGLAGVMQAGVEAAASAVKMAADFETAAAQFEVMTGSAETGAKLLKELQQTAIETPFGSADLIGAGRALLGFGVSANNVIPVVSRLSDVAGGDVQRFMGIVHQFGQVMSSGQFTKEEFNIFAEAGADVSAFARAFGGDMQHLFKGFEQGKVGAEVMVQGFNAMTDAGGRFHGMNAKMSATVQGQWNALTETVDVLKTKVGLAFFEGFRPGEVISGLATQIGEASGKTTELVAVFQKARVVFDATTAAGKAFGVVVLDRIAKAATPFQGLIDGSKDFEAAIWEGAETGVVLIGKLIEKVDLLRSKFAANFIKPLADTMKSLGPTLGPGEKGTIVEDAWYKYLPGNMLMDAGADYLKGQLTPDELKAIGKLGEAAAVAGRGLDVLLETMSQPLAKGVTDDWLRELRAARAAAQAQRKASEEAAAAAKEQRRIEVEKGMRISAAGQSFFDEAKKFQPSEYAELTKSAKLAQEALKFNPASAGQIDLFLGKLVRDATKDFGPRELRLAGAATARSQEAESIISHSLARIDGGNKSHQTRVEDLLRQIRDTSLREEQELREQGRALRERVQVGWFN